MIYVKNRELVVPGQLIAENEYRVREGAFKEGKSVFASVVGLVEIYENDIRVIPLEGRYIPKRGDEVIGIVVDSHPYGWVLDLNSPYTGNLFVSNLLQRKVDVFREDIGQYLGVGDVVAAVVEEVNELMKVQLDASMPGMGKLKGGKMLDINPTKIPRVIGKKGSMLNIIQTISKCQIRVGQNGRVIIWGSDSNIVNAVVGVLLMIEREAHISGLTDRVRTILEKIKEG